MPKHFDYDGSGATCVYCEQPITTGERVTYNSDKALYHVACKPAPPIPAHCTPVFVRDTDTGIVVDVAYRRLQHAGTPVKYRSSSYPQTNINENYCFIHVTLHPDKAQRMAKKYRQRVFTAIQQLEQHLGETHLTAENASVCRECGGMIFPGEEIADGKHLSCAGSAQTSGHWLGEGDNHNGNASHTQGVGADPHAEQATQKGKLEAVPEQETPNADQDAQQGTESDSAGEQQDGDTSGDVQSSEQGESSEQGTESDAEKTDQNAQQDKGASKDESIIDALQRLLDENKALKDENNALKQDAEQQAETPQPKQADADDHQHAAFPFLEECYLARVPVYLYGPPGSGKSYAAKTLASKYGLGEPYYMALTPMSGTFDLFGGMSPITTQTGEQVFIETEFYRCWKNGGIIAIDECDNATPELLVALNQALEAGVYTFANGETLQQHKNCYIIASGNTNGDGPTPAFPGRRKMDGAFRARFAFIAWDWDKKLESKLVLSLWPEGKAMLAWAWDARVWCASYAPHIILGPRETMRLARLHHCSVSRHDLLNAVVWKGSKLDLLTNLLKQHPAKW